MAHDTLLYPVFDYLRRHGVPLGASEYFLAVHKVREGFGVESPMQLKRLCRVLWTKSREDQELLDIAFSEYIEPQLEEMPEPEVIEAPPEEEKPVDKEGKEAKKPEPSARKENKPPPQTVQPQQLRVRPARLTQASSARVFPLYHSIKYHLVSRLPINKRDMAGSWRQFRRFSRSGLPTDLDVDATVAEICRTGFFCRPVLQPRRRNQAGLLLLIDRQGSMAAFSPFIEALMESTGGMLARVHIRYFHDCPEKALFTQANLTHPVLLEEVLSQYTKDNSVLILSDAGAARGDYDGERVRKTEKFLEILGRYTYLYAWLNPVPENRWQGSTAQEIAAMVPMFSLDKEGLSDAINVLRGQPVSVAA
ncbi:MAG: VWA domain-containing protein [Gammaproteobacteria bacterium]|nr:VWA domain-containing protein [Gammaproteobacteria bacterium]